MIRTELSFRLPNSPGSLAHVISLLASDNVQLLAFCLDASGTARVIADSPERAVGVLAAHHVHVERHDVVCSYVAARSIAALLGSAAAAGVNVEYAYASHCGNDEPVMLVLGIREAARAAA